MAIGSSPDSQLVAICPACGYPKLGDGLCALCIPTVALEIGPDWNRQPGPLTCDDASRGGGIRTHDLFVPNEARYQAAPHPA